MGSPSNQARQNSALRILVVEDDPVFTLLYSNFLASQDAEVISCVTLSDATTAVTEQSVPFDAVILDNQLPDGEGICLMPLLQQHDVAVIMASANTNPSFFLAAFKAGVDDYVEKPVNLDLLWVKICRAVEQKRTRAMATLQKQQLESWAYHEQLQQNLAKHLFDNMFAEFYTPHAAIHHWYKPHSTFSGDALLSCQGRDGSWYFMLADAMGHGLAPAMSLMPMLQCFHTMAFKALPLNNIVYELNGKLNRLLPDDRFVAACFLKFTPWTRQLELWNGGMPAILLLQADGRLVQQAESRHMALGVLSQEQLDLSTQEVDLAKVAYCVFCSDGLTEALPAKSHTTTYQQLIELLCLHSPQPFNDMEAKIPEAARHDDISLTLIDCHQLFSGHGSGQRPAETNGHSFKVQATFYGQSISTGDLPAKVIELLQAHNLPQDFLQQVFTVFTELYMNALEHGVLELDSSMKNLPDGFMQFYAEKERRIERLTDTSFIQLALAWCGATGILTLEVGDSGKGFQWSATAQGDNSVPHGRGMALIERLSDKVEIIPPGNKFKVELALKTSANQNKTA